MKNTAVIVAAGLNANHMRPTNQMSELLEVPLVGKPRCGQRTGEGMSIVQCRKGLSEIELKFPDISNFRLPIDAWMVNSEVGSLTQSHRRRLEANEAAHKPSTFNASSSMTVADNSGVNIYVAECLTVVLELSIP